MVPGTVAFVWGRSPEGPKEGKTQMMAGGAGARTGHRSTGGPVATSQSDVLWV